jgi:hypothetical protein
MSDEKATPVQDNNTQSTTISMNWKDNLPEFAKDWQEVKTSETQDDFYKQMADHRAMLGQSIRIPSKEASAEQMEEFYGKVQSKVDGLMRVPDIENDEQFASTMQKFGAPDSVDGYNIEMENNTFSPEEFNELKGMAHDAKLTKRQFKSVAEKMLASKNANAEASTQALENNRAELNKLWGAAMSDRKTIVAELAKRSEAPESLLKQIENDTVPAATMEWMYKMSQQFDGGIQIATQEQMAAAPMEASMELQDILGNPDSPYWDASHPAHQQYVDKAMALRKQRKGNAA